jgi:hypothetical protein
MWALCKRDWPFRGGCEILVDVPTDEYISIHALPLRVSSANGHESSWTVVLLVSLESVAVPTASNGLSGFDWADWRFNRPCRP